MKLVKKLSQNFIVILLAQALSLNALAVTKVKPLTVGVDGVATEANQSTDYVSSKGFSFENSDSFLLDVQSSKIYALSDGVTAPVCQAPTSSTANNLALFNSTTGHLLKELAAGSNLDILYYNSTTPAWGNLNTAGVAGKSEPYLTIGGSSNLTGERSFGVNTTNLSSIDVGANNAYTINTIQNIDTTATPTFQRLLLSGSTNQNFINGNGTMDGATGNEIAYTLAYTVNKATSGNDTGLLISMTDTLSPGTSLPLDIQVGASSKLNVDNTGKLTAANVTDSGLTSGRVTFAGTAGLLSDDADLTFATDTLTTTKQVISGSSGSVLAVDTNLLIADATNNRIGINVTSPAAALDITTSTNEKLIKVTAPAYSTVASTEFTPVTFDLSATHTFTSGAFSTQRAIRILPPTYTMGSIDTLTTAATMSIEGPPAGGTINLTNSYGLWIPTRNVTSSVQYGIGAVIAAPTGAFGSNIGMVVDGKFGMGTYTPQSYLDIQPTDFNNTMSHVCTDGVTRYSEGYFGGTQWTSIPSSGGSTLIIDTGANYPAATNFSQRTFQTLFTLDGANNYTGAIVNSNALTTVRTSAGSTTTINNNTSTVSTSSVATIATSRNFLSTSTYSGSGTVTTAANYDTINTVSGSTVTDLVGFKFSLPTVSSGTLTTVTGFDVLDQTETATNKIGFRQRGTNAHNRFNGDTSFAQDSLPGAAVDVAGKLFITNAGLVTKYNNIATVSNGVPSELGTQDITAQAAAKTATTLCTPSATGLFRISAYEQVTRAATTSSILGGATGTVITFNDGDGNVAQSNTMAMESTTGTVVTTAAGNTTGTNLTGVMTIYARTGVAIQYAIGYTSVGVTTMQFAAHLKCEAL